MVFRFRPRILVDVSQIDMSTTLLGYRISAPIMLAPTAYHKLANPEGLNVLKEFSINIFDPSLNSLSVFIPGECATARAAAACNTIMVCKPIKK